MHCPQCGYDLRAIPEERCPECGFRYDREGILAMNRDWCALRISELKYAAAFQLVGSLTILLVGVLGVSGTLFLMVGILYVFFLFILAAFWLLKAVSGSDMLVRPRDCWLWGLAGFALVIGMMSAGASQGDVIWALLILPGIMFGCIALHNCQQKLDTLSLATHQHATPLLRWMLLNFIGIAASLGTCVLLLFV